MRFGPADHRFVIKTRATGRPKGFAAVLVVVSIKELSRSLRPDTLGNWKPTSFSQVPVTRSRALSGFVALTASRLPFRDRRNLGYWLAGLGLPVVLAGLLGLEGPRWSERLIGLGCLLLISAVGVAMWQERGGRTMRSESERMRVHRARILHRLDHERRTIGLDNVLNPADVEVLEFAAMAWERIESALQSKVWLSEPILRARALQAADAALEDIIVLKLGSLRVLGITESAAHEQFHQHVEALLRLGEEVEDAIEVASSYERTSQLTAGVPMGDAAPGIVRLRETLDQLYEARAMAS